jgi:hypothetical protein
MATALQVSRGSTCRDMTIEAEDRHHTSLRKAKDNGAIHSDMVKSGERWLYPESVLRLAQR